MRVKIEQTRTFATGADGGAVSRAYAERGDPSPPRSFAAALPRTPPPTFFLDDEVGPRWLAQTGVVDVIGSRRELSTTHAQVERRVDDAVVDEEALGAAWVEWTCAGFV